MPLLSGKITPMFSKLTRFWILILLTFTLASCGSEPALTPTETATSSPLPAATPTATPTSIPSPTHTPPSHPGPYQAGFLYTGDTPHTYITEPCQYIHDKWTSTNAAPGTVVMVIMFHSVTGKPVVSPNQISEADFRLLMQSLHDNGFEAITTAQLADFMETNAYIPPRSVLLTADDRHYRKYFDTLFRQYWQDWGWPVVNAWISLDDSIGRAALPENVALENEGWVDHQAHGVIHNVPMGPDSTDTYIYGELQGSIDVFQQSFGKHPIAIIWPGGGFAERPVEVARELGYRLGFTVNPRGPLMYNWVPLADSLDPNRPFWMPEGQMNDPLLVLPRYWDTDAILHMNEVIQMGQGAADYAAAQRSVELEYYEIVCSSTYGPLH
jgi:hypothetical protein